MYRYWHIFYIWMQSFFKVHCWISIVFINFDFEGCIINYTHMCVDDFTIKKTYYIVFVRGRFSVFTITRITEKCKIGYSYHEPLAFQWWKLEPLNVVDYLICGTLLFSNALVYGTIRWIQYTVYEDIACFILSKYFICHGISNYVFILSKTFVLLKEICIKVVFSE